MGSFRQKASESPQAFSDPGVHFGLRACPGLRSRTRAAAIFVDELDAGGFQRLPNDFKYRAAPLAANLFELMDRHDTDLARSANIR